LSPKRADSERLGASRAKRSADATPEPFGAPALGVPPLGSAGLLVKTPDAWSGGKGARALTPESVLGLTLEGVKDGSTRAEAIRQELRRLGAPRHGVRAQDVGLMLAETREKPFSDKGWLFELKYDGYRVLAAREPGRNVLRYRRGADAASIFPEVTQALSALPFGDLVMDGEVVILEADGKPSFQKLQRRALLSRPTDIARAAVRLPASFYAFDLLGFEDFDLRSLPLEERKALLRKVVPRAGPLRFSDHVGEHGVELFEEIRKRGLEGLVAKKADGPYRPGRSSLWLKIRLDRTDDFVIVGLSPPRRSRAGFGALHIAKSDGAELVYAGKVGSGFSESDLARIRELLEPHRTAAPTFQGAPSATDDQWVEPRLLCEVRYKEWAREGHLRHPVFLRLREDKPIEDLPVPPETPPDSQSEAPSRVAFTNLGKVFWPEEGFAKGDLIEYYRSVSPWLLPYLKDRPLVLTRYPDGISGKNFFQKDAPGFAPGWVRTTRMWSEHAQRGIDYFVCDTEDTLLYLVNLGTIPLHIWSSRVATLDNPDWSILDLDPKGAPFKDVVEVARTIRKICDHMELPSFVKTSGSSGLHVLLPLGGQCTYAKSRSLAELVSRVVVQELPEIATMVRAISSRGGRVYLDFLQNGHGRLLVSPLSVRPLKGATVSTPLTWSEVGAGLDPSRFTIRSVPRRLEKLKADPLRPVLSERPDLARALSWLRERLDGGR
jgi:bifunctional non-homologous end joining protein LigD